MPMLPSPEQTDAATATAATAATTTALQPYMSDDASGAPYTISPELIQAAQAARSRAQQQGRDRRYEMVWVKTSLLVPADYNPRYMPEEDMGNLRRSLSEFGMVEPIVVNTFEGREGVIVGGHQRLSAALAEGWEQVAVVWIYVPPMRERALNIGLNRIHGQWDEDKLATLVHDMSTQEPDALKYTGFSDREIDEALAVFSQNTAGDIMAGEDDEDVPPMEDIPPICQPGDLWQLGPHLLLCGDSTWPNDVARLMGEQRAVLMWTDPPYGVSYEGKTKKKLTIENDGQLDLDGFLERAFACADRLALASGAAIYICHPMGAASVTFGVRFLAAGWRLHETLIWVKDSMVLGHSDYHGKHESIIYGYKPTPPGSGRRGRGGEGWYGDDAQTTVFEVKRPKASREHPTMKPLALIAPMMANSSLPGDLIYEPFCGSGSTLLVAHALERVCRAIELSPRYADVTLARFENEYHIKPVLLERREQPAAAADTTTTTRTTTTAARPRADVREEYVTADTLLLPGE